MALQAIFAALARLGPILGRATRNLPLPKNLQSMFRAFTTPGGRTSRSHRARRARQKAFGLGLGQLGTAATSFPSPRHGGIFGQLGSGISNVAGGAGLVAGATIGGPFGAVVGAASIALGNMVQAIGEAVDKLRQMGFEIQKANFQFATFSPAMARVQQEQGMQSAFLSMERGERRSGAARGLMRGQTAFERDVAGPIEDAFSNIESYFTGFVLDKLSEYLKPLGDMADRLSQILDQLMGMEPPKGIPVDQFFRELGVNTPSEYARPQRFGKTT